MELKIKERCLFPFKDEHWKKKLLIGGVLSFVPSLIIFMFLTLSRVLGLPVFISLIGLIFALVGNSFILGYVKRIIKSGILQEKAQLPEWNDWKDLFISGIKMIAIALVYSFPAAILISIMNNLESISIFGFFVVLITIPVVICTILFIPFIAVRYVETESLKMTIEDFKLLVCKIKSILYKYIILAVIFVLSFFIAGGFLNMIPFIGFILWGFFAFYLWVIAARVVGELYVSSKVVEVTPIEVEEEVVEAKIVKKAKTVKKKDEEKK
jgi:hypothetical protein